MIKSMTGYASESFIINTTKFLVEIKSVNSKNIDLSIRIPQILKSHENDLRKKFDKDELNYVQKNLHNVLWGGGGTGDTDIFYALVKLILAKFYDEQNTADNEEYKFQIF